jgi:dolichyl-phosphate mannosyltransferase polypeptide 2 regulatory subunit
MLSERALGGALLAASSVGFCYYSVWVLALPFVDADQPLHALFPPRHLAVALPAYAIVVRERVRRRKAGHAAVARAKRAT